MTIEITRPELEALLLQRLKASGFDNAEDVILEALREFHPKAAPSTSGRTLADICARVQGLTEDLSIERDPSPGRDIRL